MNFFGTLTWRFVPISALVLLSLGINLYLLGISHPVAISILCATAISMILSIRKYVLEPLERLSRAAEELEDARLIAESANRAKSAFLLNMSHDLRTPLNAIIGFSEALSQGVYGELRTDHREYLGYIHQSGMKLLKMVNEVLDLSRMESGGMELDYTECNVNDLINNALYLFREKTKKHRIGLTAEVADDAKSLTADAVKIKQVLVNLLTDSIRATPEGGSIEIKAAKVRYDHVLGHGGAERDASIRQSVGQQECIQITITDSRAGMTGEERLRFFDPYKQFDAALDSKQDNLALLLSKRFVELHGGRIWAEPQQEQVSGEMKSMGNRFIFVLPQSP